MNTHGAVPAHFASRSPAIRWYAVFVLAVLNMVAFLDRQIIALVVAPLQSDLGLSDIEISLLQGFAFAIFYATAGLGVGWLVDRANRRNILLFGLSVWSLSCAACGLASSFWGLFMARIGVGAGESSVAPAANSMISDMFPPQRLSLALGAYASGANFGVAMSLGLGGILVGWLEGIGPVALPMLGVFKPWQMAFVLVGALGILAVPLLLTVAEPLRQPRSSEAMLFLKPLARFFAQRRAVLSCHFLGFGLNHLFGFALLGWAPSYLTRRFDWPPSDIGISLGLAFGITGIIGAFLGGWLAYRLARAGVEAVYFKVQAGASILIVPLAAIAFSTDDPLLFLGAIGLAFTCSAMSVPQASTALQLITPPALRGRIAAVYVLWTSVVGAGLGPLLVAGVTELFLGDRAMLGTSLMWVICIAAAGSSLFMVLGIRPLRHALADQLQPGPAAPLAA